MGNVIGGYPHKRGEIVDIEKILNGLECRAYDNDVPCCICAYHKRDDEHAIPYCDYRGLMDDAIELLKQQDDEIRQLRLALQIMKGNGIKIDTESR